MTIINCPICREPHGSDRGLNFDGKGINSCGIYRSRIATIPPEYAHIGPMLAACPGVLDLAKDALSQLKKMDFSCSANWNGSIKTNVALLLKAIIAKTDIR